MGNFPLFYDPLSLLHFAEVDRLYFSCVFLSEPSPIIVWPGIFTDQLTNSLILVRSDRCYSCMLNNGLKQLGDSF